MLLEIVASGLGVTSVIGLCGWSSTYFNAKFWHRQSDAWRDLNHQKRIKMDALLSDLDNSNARNEALATNCARAFVERNEALRKVAALEAFKARRNMSKAQRAKPKPELSARVG